MSKARRKDGAVSPVKGVFNISDYSAHLPHAEAIALRLMKPPRPAKVPKPVTIKKYSWEL